MLDQDGDGILSKEELSVIKDRPEVSGVNGATFMEFSRKYARSERGSLSEEEALQSLASAIQLDPQLSDLYVQRGKIWVSRKEWDKAIAEFDSAIRVDSNIAQIYLARGNARKSQGLFVTALQDFSEVTRIRR
jgi:tetratricopeptide (TPR) repeat protein